MATWTEGRASKVIVVSTACVVGAGLFITYHLRQRRFWRCEKPQRGFRFVFADNSDSSFSHLSVNDGPHNDISGCELHPYVHDILATKEADASQAPSTAAVPDASVPWKWVDTRQQLDALVEELEGLECFALDTEFHKQRSYHGFVCLIQVSTGSCIYLLDAIALHDELHALNCVFSNPKIRKVLHGCHNDIIWLQKDFRAYLVNVFDTEKACQALKKPKSNLAHLLEVYFGVRTDKSLQQGDWRKRPLTEDQIEYAKLDVQYLLCLESVLKQELAIDRKIFLHAVQKSHDLTLNLFQKLTSKDAATSAALHLIRHYFDSAGKGLHQGDYDVSQERPFMSCVYRLCLWRDAIARKEDESPEFVLKGKLISLLAREMPTSELELLECIRETPLYDYSTPNHEPFYWQPPSVFLKRVKEVVAVLDEVRNGCFVWTEGPQLLDPCKKQNKTKSKKQTAADRERAAEIFCAKSKVYDNCKMLSLEGELLCYCDRRNLEWYVRKKIAKVESLDPFVIRLLFQHRVTDEMNESHDFYVQSRVNCCVACGEEGHYLRYKIIPACYRKQFPVALKSHRSHDVVLLCMDCHHVAQTAADRLKRALAKEYDVPLTPLQCDSENGQSAAIRPTRVRAAALALQNSREKIPPQRLRELEETIHLYYGRDPKQHGSVSADDLKLAALIGMNKRDRKKTLKLEDGPGFRVTVEGQPKNGFDSGEQLHGELVVKKALENGGEAELYTIMRRFREVFVDAVQPKHLPKKWDIDHFAPRRFGQNSIFFRSDDSAENIA